MDFKEKLIKVEQNFIKTFFNSLPVQKESIINGLDIFSLTCAVTHLYHDNKFILKAQCGKYFFVWSCTRNPLLDLNNFLPRDCCFNMYHINKIN